jgi:F0F1-type ATP synthase epsilon subunit
MADEAAQPDVSNPPEQTTQAPKGKLTMAVKVYAPFKVYFEGEAYSVSAVNDVGPFDILPHHHNFLCMLVPCTLSIETPKGQQTIKIHRALMHVKADRVVVFVDV